MAMARRTATTIRNNPSPPSPHTYEKGREPALPAFFSYPFLRVAQQTHFLKSLLLPEGNKKRTAQKCDRPLLLYKCPLERITDGKVETYAVLEAGNVVPAAAAGVVRRVQADAHVETDDDEVEVVAQARARADGRFGLSPRFSPRLRHSRPLFRLHGRPALRRRALRGALL